MYVMIKTSLRSSMSVPKAVLYLKVICVTELLPEMRIIMFLRSLYINYLKIHLRSLQQKTRSRGKRQRVLLLVIVFYYVVLKRFFFTPFDNAVRIGFTIFLKWIQCSLFFK